MHVLSLIDTLCVKRRIRRETLGLASICLLKDRKWLKRNDQGKRKHTFVGVTVTHGKRVRLVEHNSSSWRREHSVRGGRSIQSEEEGALRGGRSTQRKKEHSEEEGALRGGRSIQRRKEHSVRGGGSQGKEVQKAEPQTRRDASQD